MTDPRIWRVVGDPLVRPTGSGALTDQTVAVKDVLAVAGQRIGAGNPAWLEHAVPELAHAWAVERLLADGAAVRGIAQTDELAYSLAGVNPHYGAPPNPLAPHRIPGGSSSGPASAVSMSEATIGLGTDTAGSIRVPAAYQGLWGIRPTVGAVRVDGLLPLASSFDTVGWLTHGPTLLAEVGRSLLPPGGAAVGEVVVVDELLALADADVAAAVGALAAGLPRIGWPMASMPGMLAAMQTVQAYEAWRAHGAWLATRPDALGADVRSRFARAAAVTPAQADAARAELDRHRTGMRGYLGDRVLLLPAASSVAPPVGRPRSLDAVRQATLQLTCVATIGGLPAVSVPVTTDGGLPAGACLVGPASSDHALIELARRIGETRSDVRGRRAGGSH
ncbi:glutamyl-tRNA amidotransferase [Aeromicrobium sp. S22]|uniref:amidase family protein n=1 Tax=Aeromicrobium sp. S22 TaxID=2662029 RepID=UPI00129E7C6A|nr:amidase family protein [Aeromicrobium sp. S22]MRK00797.1 glutamyl-tRNA amidotransferase [Aeromicrobium sp. S22]